MKILALEFERAYSNGIEDDYSDEVIEQFTEWFDGIFLTQKMIEYDGVDTLVFERLTAADKKRVRNKLKEYSE